MARDYESEMKKLIAADNQQEIKQVAGTFQTKIVKYLESTLGSPDGVRQTRIKLATYTASHAAYGDLTRMLRARDVLARFNDALPAAIDKFDDARVSQVAQLLDAFRKNNVEELAFAIALVAMRLKPPWQLIRLATQLAPTQ